MQSSKPNPSFVDMPAIMKAKFICFGVISFLFPAHLLAATPEHAAETRNESNGKVVSYSVERVDGNDADATARYFVEVSFTGTPTGKTTLRIPNNWAQANSAYKGIKDLSLLTKEAQRGGKDQNGNVVITHPPGIPLVVRYELRQIHPGAPSAPSQNRYLPFIQPSYIHWFGATSFVTPGLDMQEKFSARLNFKNFPSSWMIASSFGVSSKTVTFNGSHNDFLKSVLVAGEFRMVKKVENGVSLTVAAPVGWKSDTEQLAKRTMMAIDSERQFWRDSMARNLLVTVMPLEAPPNFRAFDGTSLTNSVAMFMTDNTSNEQIDFFIIHELFHLWNPSSFGPQDEQGQRLAWFVEGFTDYYSHLLRLRSNSIRLEDYVEQFNIALRNLAISEHRNATNEFVAMNAFNDHTLNRFPYWRGMLLAANWDLSIRIANNGGKSLDDAMRALLVKYRTNPDMRFGKQQIAEAVRAFGVVAPEKDIDRFIVNGENLALKDGALSQCVRFSQIEVDGFEMGFDRMASHKSGKISGVLPSSNAHAAGLRNGDILVSHSVSFGDPGRDATVEVNDGNGTKKIVFRPSRASRIEAQRAEVVPGLDGKTRAACLAALGVGPDRN